ncbi:hypothetical protein BH11PSE5_BH11PSE5_04950 [soil metagenome]|uniref:group I truncated hemoglobin n=1 Tax=Sphingobium sp. CECT 9361 TaxID=2845384 RepID=UPI001E391321|nr:group 1 truncated hemoglobin [Sphingobium sp. CECT 9361]CAH0355603.1 hypothetical protein SPH9361_03645 [Sphingobium sp. CECT 9361]
MSLLFALLLLQASPVATSPARPYAVPGEEAVDPYTVEDVNVGAKPFDGDGMAEAFHGQEGIRRIVDRMVTLSYGDSEIGEIFKGHDKVRLKRTLFEQFCYILNASCIYTGRDMVRSHKDLGVHRKDMNRLVELLQQAMREEGVDFQAQNRLLSKLAPMHHDIVGR